MGARSLQELRRLVEGRRSADGAVKTYEILFCRWFRARRSAEQRSPGNRLLKTDKLGLEGGGAIVGIGGFGDELTFLDD